MSDDEERFCARCGDSEFDDEGEETHIYDDYDHDFVPEEEDEEQSTLEQVGELADTVKKIAEAGYNEILAKHSSLRRVKQIIDFIESKLWHLKNVLGELAINKFRLNRFHDHKKVKLKWVYVVSLS